jgi:hypothetical protein
MEKTQMLVNGKPMSNEQYLALLKQAREAQEVYKSTPSYKAEVEARRKLSEKRIEFVTKFIDFGKKLGLDLREIGSVGYSVYLASRKEE